MLRLYTMQKKRSKQQWDKIGNTFGKCGNTRGNSGRLKRDYELTKEQLSRREYNRKRNGCKKAKEYGILIWYDGNLEKSVQENMREA